MEITREEYEAKIKELEHDAFIAQMSDSYAVTVAEMNGVNARRAALEEIFKHGKHHVVKCPYFSTECPYYIKGRCGIEDPIKDCEDFADFYGSWESWEDLLMKH